MRHPANGRDPRKLVKVGERWAAPHAVERCFHQPHDLGRAVLGLPLPSATSQQTQGNATTFTAKVSLAAQPGISGSLSPLRLKAKKKLGA